MIPLSIFFLIASVVCFYCRLFTLGAMLYVIHSHLFIKATN